MALDNQDVDAIVALVRHASFAGVTSDIGVTRPTRGQIGELDAAEVEFRKRIIGQTSKPQTRMPTCVAPSKLMRYQELVSLLPDYLAQLETATTQGLGVHFLERQARIKELVRELHA